MFIYEVKVGEERHPIRDRREREADCLKHNKYQCNFVSFPGL